MSRRLFNILPFLGHPVLNVVLVSLTLHIGVIESVGDRLFHFFPLFLGDNSVFDQLFFINFDNWLHLSDLVVHEWLSESWLIQFIVAELSVSNQIDHNVLSELLSVFSCSSESFGDIVNCVSIDMEYRGVNTFG